MDNPFHCTPAISTSPLLSTMLEPEQDAGDAETNNVVHLLMPLSRT